MPTRLQIAAMVFMMVNAVVFGVGIVPVLMIPSLANHGFERRDRELPDQRAAVLVHRAKAPRPLLENSTH